MGQRLPDELADEDYCYLTTVGRVSGRPHTIEIWFGLHGSTAYLLSGGRERADWVRNLVVEPRVTVRIAGHEMSAHARVVSDPDEDQLARRLLFDKYRPGYDGDLTRWRTGALPVALDLNATASGPQGQGPSPLV